MSACILEHVARLRERQRDAILLHQFAGLVHALLRKPCAAGSHPEWRQLYEETLPRLFFVVLLAVIGVRAGQIITGLWSNYEGMEANWLQLEPWVVKGRR